MKKNNEVRFDNRLSNFGLKGLSNLEQNLWWTLARLIKDRGTDAIFISRSEIERISGYSGDTLRTQSFVKNMRTMGSKIVSLNTNFYEEETESWVIFALFPLYKVSERGVSIEVSRYFQTWFNNIESNFTRLDVTTLINLKSVYSKELYRFLMRWKNLRPNLKNPGFWSIDINDFRTLMCVPASYNTSKMKAKIIEPAIKELTTINKYGFPPLENLSVKYILKPGTKKKVDRLEFTFKQSDVSKWTKKNNDLTFSNQSLLNPPLESRSNQGSYANNFKNGYIPGENSPIKGFSQWLSDLGFFSDNEEYFDMRGAAYNDLISLYKTKVMDVKSKAWNDMRFFASIYSVVTNDKPMTSWAIEEAYSELRKGKHIDISQKFYSSLPIDKGTQLESFCLKGEVL